MLQVKCLLNASHFDLNWLKLRFNERVACLKLECNWIQYQKEYLIRGGGGGGGWGTCLLSNISLPRHLMC